MTQNKWDEDVTTNALLALGALNRNHALFLIVLIAVWEDGYEIKLILPEFSRDRDQPKEIFPPSADSQKDII